MQLNPGPIHLESRYYAPIALLKSGDYWAKWTPSLTVSLREFLTQEDMSKLIFYTGSEAADLDPIAIYENRIQKLNPILVCTHSENSQKLYNHSKPWFDHSYVSA